MKPITPKPDSLLHEMRSQLREALDAYEDKIEDMLAEKEAQ